MGFTAQSLALSLLLLVGAAARAAEPCEGFGEGKERFCARGALDLEHCESLRMREPESESQTMRFFLWVDLPFDVQEVLARKKFVWMFDAPKRVAISKAFFASCDERRPLVRGEGVYLGEVSDTVEFGQPRRRKPVGEPPTAFLSVELDESVPKLKLPAPCEQQGTPPDAGPEILL